MQFHVLGVTMLPIVGTLLVADARNRPAGPERRRIWRYGAAGLAIVALSFTPLVIHELTTDFAEVNAALAYIRNGGDPTALEPLARLLIIEARVLSWPLTGLLTDAPTVALFAVVVVVAIVVWRAMAGEPRERGAAVWLGLGLAWTACCLTFISPSLASVVPGLPNDHYHAFADPMVFAIVGMGAGGLWRVGSGVRGGWSAIGPVLTVVAVVALVAWNVANWPPAVTPDGGFPAADQAATRILGSAGAGELTLRSLPDFKSAEAYAYPLVRAGAVVHADTGTGPIQATSGTVVVVCDALFETVIGAQCGGPAEATVAPPDRFGNRSIASKPPPAGPSRSTEPPPDATAQEAGTRRARPARRARRAHGRPLGAAPEVPGSLACRARRESRTPAPQTPAFAAPRPGSWRANPGRALVCASNAPGRDRLSGRPNAPC